jgi:hypothetical protein
MYISYFPVSSIVPSHLIFIYFIALKTGPVCLRPTIYEARHHFVFFTYFLMSKIKKQCSINETFNAILKHPFKHSTSHPYIKLLLLSLHLYRLCNIYLDKNEAKDTIALKKPNPFLVLFIFSHIQTTSKSF